MSAPKKVAKKVNKLEAMQNLLAIEMKLKADYEAMKNETFGLEVEKECQEEDLMELSGKMESLKKSLEKIEVLWQQAKKKQLLAAQRLSLIQDMSGLLQGRLFFNSPQGAVFFTQTIYEFTASKKVEESYLRKRMKEAGDGVSFRLGKRSYCYLQARDGHYYFYPEELDLEGLLSISE